MSPEFIAILVFAGIVGPLQVLILGLLWNLAGRIGKVEGLLEGLLAERSRGRNEGSPSTPGLT